MRPIEENEFNLDFPQPEEQKNFEVKERDLYPRLAADGFKFSDSPDGGSGSAYIMKDGKFLFLEQNKEIARMGGHAAKVARDDIEKNLGESVVTKQNRLNYEYKEEKQLEILK
jgi:hypothetical protein